MRSLRAGARDRDRRLIESALQSGQIVWSGNCSTAVATMPRAAAELASGPGTTARGRYLADVGPQVMSQGRRPCLSVCSSADEQERIGRGAQRGHHRRIVQQRHRSELAA